MCYAGDLKAAPGLTDRPIGIPSWFHPISWKPFSRPHKCTQNTVVARSSSQRPYVIFRTTHDRPHLPWCPVGTLCPLPPHTLVLCEDRVTPRSFFPQPHPNYLYPTHPWGSHSSPLFLKTFPKSSSYTSFWQNFHNICFWTLSERDFCDYFKL